MKPGTPKLRLCHSATRKPTVISERPWLQDAPNPAGVMAAIGVKAETDARRYQLVRGVLNALQLAEAPDVRLLSGSYHHDKSQSSENSLALATPAQCQRVGIPLVLAG